MELLLPKEIAERIESAMRKAGRQEIGGLLMGEHVDGENFRLVDISIQTLHGTHSTFERDPALHQAELDAFFKRTGADYKKFNYIGEWHSHPSYEPLPSRTDMQTMQAIVRNPAVNVNFAVLIIARLAGRGRLALSATAFLKDARPQTVTLVAENSAEPKSWLQRVAKAVVRAFTTKPSGRRVI